MISLNEDIYRQIIITIGRCSEHSAYRDQECIDALSTCCLVNKTWHRLAKPILESVLVLTSEKHGAKRLNNRTDAQLAKYRHVIVGVPSGLSSGYYNQWHLETLFKNLSVPQLRSIILYAGAVTNKTESDRSHIGTKFFHPPPLGLKFSSLLELLLGPYAGEGGCSWTPLLQVTPALNNLTLYHVAWTGRSTWAKSPLYLPENPPSFRLKRLDICRSFIGEEPMKWLLSSSSESLQHVRVRDLQHEWETFVHISALRGANLLPKVRHLTIETSERDHKDFNAHLTLPLAEWSQIETMYVYGRDDKCRAAIIHGIARLNPVPLVEMGVGDMQMRDFKALFKLRKGKLQHGTTLRLVTRCPGWRERGGEGGRWSTEKGQYWTDEDIVEEAKEFAAKYGVKLTSGSQPIYD